MGKYINPDVAFDDETKEFLRSRSRQDEVIENERRFPPGGKPAEHEGEGYMPLKEGYDYRKQAEKVEDAGGRLIEPIPVDDNGHPIVPEYGYDDVDGDEIDDDILDKVLDYTVDELKDELKKLKEKTSGNKDELVDRLANALQDKRDEANKTQE